MAQRFDAAYYGRFYGRRPVHDRRHIARLGEGVISLASWWRIPIRSVLDVGAGKGYWRSWLETAHPTVKYHGIDASEYACKRMACRMVALRSREKTVAPLLKDFVQNRGQPHASAQ